MDLIFLWFTTDVNVLQILHQQLNIMEKQTEKIKASIWMNSANLPIKESIFSQIRKKPSQNNEKLSKTKDKKKHFWIGQAQSHETVTKNKKKVC